MEDSRIINEKLFQMQKQLDYLAFAFSQLNDKLTPMIGEEGNVKEINQSRAARYLGTNSQLLIRLRDRGFLHPRKQGGLWMYKVSELENYKRRYSL